MAARSSGERVALMEFIGTAGEAAVETMSLMCERSLSIRKGL